jgi:DMSO/TMAO reductase YedYZ heme-binding membrane subunit
MVRLFLIVVVITVAGMTTTSRTASALVESSNPHSEASSTSVTTRPVVSDPDGSLKREAHVAGYCAYALMFGTVVWGMLTTAGTVRRSVRRQTIYGTHMVLSIMALSFTALHAMSHLFKRSNPMSPLRELVPFMSEFHVTLGVIAFELMVLAAVSVWIQRRLSYHRWHVLHRIAYPAYILVIAHVLLSAHHLSDGIVITTMAVTAACVAAFAVICLHPSHRLPAGDAA